MVSAQIERLQKDSSQLELFIKELRNRGDFVRMSKIEKKKNYLDDRLAEIIST